MEKLRRNAPNASADAGWRGACEGQMTRKRFIPAFMLGGATMWGLAGLWHEVLMPRFYAAATGATHEGAAIILAAYMALGALMAYLYPIGYQGGRPVAEGLRFGLLIGVLWVFPHGLAMAGAHGTSIAYVFKNTGWHLIEQGVGGLVIGWIYGRGASKSDAPS